MDLKAARAKSERESFSQSIVTIFYGGFRMNSRAKYECRILAAILLCALSNLFPAKASGGTFALVQHVNNISCPSSSTTCTIPLNQTIAAGDLLIFESTVSGNNLITATDNGGTFVPCRSCVGFDQTNLFAETSGGWILSASPQSAAITVTYSGSNGGFGAIEMWEYSYSGGAPGFDGANQIEIQNSSSPTASTFTPSGSNDISVQACASNSAGCNSVSAPFLGDNLGGALAWAHLNSPTNWTAPTWTLASVGVSQLTQMEFGFDVKPCGNTMFMDFGGPDGSAINLAQLSPGTYGWQGGQRFTTGTAADLTFSTSASHPLQNPTGRLCDGGNYSDSSTSGLQYSTSDPRTYLQINGSTVAYGTLV